MKKQSYSAKYIPTKVSLFAMVGLFSASLFIGIASPQALAKTSVGTSYSDCQANVNKESLSEIRKQYKPSMEKRLRIVKYIKEKRLEYIKTQDAQIHKNYERTDNIGLSTTVRSERDKALKAVNGTAKYPLAHKNDPRFQDTTNIEAITNRIAAAEQVVQAGVDATSSGSNKSKGQTTNAICKAVHEGAVYSQLIPYARKEVRNASQTLIQQCTWMNVVDRARAAKDVYEAKKAYAKAHKGTFDADGSLGKRVDDLYASSERLIVDTDALGVDVQNYDGKSYQGYMDLKKRANAIADQNDGSDSNGAGPGTVTKLAFDVYTEVMKTGIVVKKK